MAETRGWHLWRKGDGRVEFASSPEGDFKGVNSHDEPWLFTTEEAAKEAWRMWANKHPAWAADWVPVVREVRGNAKR